MIPTYKNFEEKKEYFKIIKIDSLQDFTLFFKSHIDERKGIYRGINNAKYKIFTTLQREKLLGNISNEFSVENYVNNFREKPLIKKYFETININLSKISALSFLQHYKSPTPLIDFTTNIEVALFFAIENMIDNPWNNTENEIENYFSIFHVDGEDTKLINIERVIEGIEEMKNQMDSLIFDKVKHNNLMLNHIDKMMDIGTMEVYLVNLENKFRSFSTLNNIRILSQEGLFINNTFGIEPLESALQKFFIPATHFVGSELDEMEDIPQIKKQNEQYLKDLDENREIQSKLADNILYSYEINKSLIPQIAKIIKIDKNLIYIDFDKLCMSIFEESK
jgi:hypothetical protein